MYATISRMLVPEQVLNDFEIYDAKESKSRWVIDLYEKPDRIPSALQAYSDAVLDGYCDLVEMLSSCQIINLSNMK
jgi:hypothetical protein